MTIFFYAAPSFTVRRRDKKRQHFLGMRNKRRTVKYHSFTGIARGTEIQCTLHSVPSSAGQKAHHRSSSSARSRNSDGSLWNHQKHSVHLLSEQLALCSRILPPLQIPQIPSPLPPAALQWHSVFPTSPAGPTQASID